MIGARRLRKEDSRFLTGRGRYLADHHVDRLHHVALLRSPAAHAVIRGIDTTAASALPGVVGVYTQADLDAAGAQRMGHLLEMPGMQPLEWTILASDRVRFAGEPVAAVVAVSRAVAEDALELVELDLETLPAVVDPARALAPDAPLLYPEWGTNELLHLEAASPRPRRHHRRRTARAAGAVREPPHHGAAARRSRGPGRVRHRRRAPHDGACRRSSPTSCARWWPRCAA